MENKSLIFNEGWTKNKSLSNSMFFQMIIESYKTLSIDYIFGKHLSFMNSF